MGFFVGFESDFPQSLKMSILMRSCWIIIYSFTSKLTNNIMHLECLFISRGIIMSTFCTIEYIYIDRMICIN